MSAGILPVCLSAVIVPYYLLGPSGKHVRDGLFFAELAYGSRSRPRKVAVMSGGTAGLPGNAASSASIAL